MLRRVTIVACLALIGTLAGAGTGWAHTLKIHRGEKASLREEPEHCAPVDPDCDEYLVENCRRPDREGYSKHWARHRVLCDITMYGDTDSDGEKNAPWHCHWSDQWSIREGSTRLYWSSIVYHETYDECPYD